MSWIVAGRPRSLCIALCLAWSTAGASPHPLVLASLADLSLEELGDIEITSVSKRAQPLSNAAAAVFVITADDIRRSGADSLPEVLRLAPHLHVAQVDNSAYAVTARGLGGNSANKLLVLIDGRSVYTPLFAGVFWDIQDVMLQDIERIEVVSGPGGTLWGVNAVNGVINVITRAAQDTQGGLLAAGLGNRGTDVAARYGGTIGDDGHYRVYAKRFNRHHSRLANGRDVDDAWRMAQTGFRTDWRKAHDSVMVQGNAHQGDHGQPPPGSIVINGVPLALKDIDTRGSNLLVQWVRELDNGGQWQTQAYLDYTERVVPPTFSERLDIGDIQVQYAAPQAARHAWVLGAQHRHSRDHVFNSPYFSFLPARIRQSWSSLFLQDDITLTDNLDLIVGARLESNDYTGLEWLPNARIAWKPSARHLLWGAASRTVRAPSRLDHDPFIPSSVFPVWPPSLGPRPTYLLGGGPDIPSEVAQVLEIGYRGQPTAQTTLSATLYRTLYDKLHTQETGRREGFFVFAGNMTAAATGLEIWGNYQPSPSWRLSGGFTGLYQRFWLRPGSNDTANLAPARGRDPAQTWLLRSAWDLPHAQEFDVAARHVSRLRSPDVPSYMAVDVRWGWRVRPDMELSLVGRNVFDRGHGELTAITTRTEIGSSFVVQASARF